MLNTLDNKELTVWRLSGEKYGLSSVELGDRVSASINLENGFPKWAMVELRRRFQRAIGG